MIVNLYGSMEGKRHNSGMLAMSGVLPQQQLNARTPYDNPLCAYVDPTCTLGIHLQGPFKGNLNQQQKYYNQAVSQVRTPVEWVFGDIANYFAFLDFKRTLKINMKAIKKMYSVCTLLTNAHTCLYQSIISSYFGMEPPLLDEYFI